MELENLIDDIKSDIEGDLERIKNFQGFTISDYKRRIESIACALSRIVEENGDHPIAYIRRLQVGMDDAIN